MTVDKMAGWHHQLSEHEFEQFPGDGEGQESLACWSPWVCKDSDTSEPQTRTIKTGIQMANEHMKRCSKLLVIREMQIKTTIRYHLTLVRMVIIKKSTNNKRWRGCGKKQTLLHCWWECKLIQPLWKTVRRFLKKLGIKAPYDSAIPLLGIYPEETKI